MFCAAISLALLLGLDSLIVCGALGPVRLRPARRLRLATCFGLCDGLAVLLGSTLRMEWVSEALSAVGGVAPLAAGAYGLFTLYLACRSRATQGGTDLPGGGWLMYGLPVCLSLDNLVAGAAVGGAGLPVAQAAGLSASISGLMAFAGLWAGEEVGKRLPIRAAYAGGVALIAAAVALALVRGNSPREFAIRVPPGSSRRSGGTQAAFVLGGVAIVHKADANSGRTRRPPRRAASAAAFATAPATTWQSRSVGR